MKEYLEMNMEETVEATQNKENEYRQTILLLKIAQYLEKIAYNGE